MIENEIKKIITIGASAGGFGAVSKVLTHLPENFPAAIFIVIHIGKDASNQIILNTIQKSTRLKCEIAFDGCEIENSVVYIAPADHHLMVDKGTILVKNGATENNWRPSIDVLFRSAAANYDSCVIGIVLSGLLYDGTSGMNAIKRSGGVCIVQDPNEAQFADMPQNVLSNVSVDHQVSAEEIGYILIDLLAEKKPCIPKESPKDVKLEAEITKRMSSNVDEVEQLGVKTNFTCPDCGGMLTKINTDKEPRYKCFTGHVYSEALLGKLQDKNIENSIWVAIRMMEERKNLLNSLSENNPNSTQKIPSNNNSDRVNFLSEHIERLKTLLTDIGSVNSNKQANKD
ncbi:chemotaxis protein CheB [Pedobacter mucosus]|uniref:chemotaxis protein CheB n=1 Tax=Pedobacter mucosus TaxID=2895286 RepID=UPI001EE4D8D6|nr:chemotaxis protein CheB [Pedobacter mucosus]UKT65278.1 chemotaxis protein CheB [Pedobacter mucosus]